MTPEEHAQMVELAGMKRECIYCHGTGYTHEPFAGRGQGGQNDTNAKYMCEGCHGTGEVYILDAGVRVPCTPIEYFDAGAYSACEKSRPCSKCAGRGWTPTEDFVTWCWALEAVRAYAIRLGLKPQSVSIYWEEEAWEGGVPGKLIDAERVLAALARR